MKELSGSSFNGGIITMITSAEQFVYLRESENPSEYHRAAHEEAPIAVWLDVIARYPEMQKWVVNNKTVPLEILEILSTSPDEHVRSWVAGKRKLSYALFELLSQDASEGVRRSIVYNAKTPLPILQRLTEDAWENIAEKAKVRLAGKL